MKPRMVYILGGPGTGKSTFATELLDELGVTLADDGRTLVPGPGVLLAGPRKPQADAAANWLTNEPELPSRIIADGLPFATRPFLAAARKRTDLKVVYLTCSTGELHRRYIKLGISKPGRWIQSIVEHCDKLAASIPSVMKIDSVDEDEWGMALDLSAAHLGG